MIQACLGDKVLIPCIEDDSKLEVLIPEGIQSGSKIKIQGKGIPYLNSNNRGDFYLRIKVLIPKNLSENQKELLRQFSNNGEGEDLK